MEKDPGRKLVERWGWDAFWPSVSMEGSEERVKRWYWEIFTYYRWPKEYESPIARSTTLYKTFEEAEVGLKEEEKKEYCECDCIHSGNIGSRIVAVMVKQ